LCHFQESQSSRDTYWGWEQWELDREQRKLVGNY
jgi:hypothetical protein